MKTKIYSYVRLINDSNDEDYGKYVALCISENGNLYYNEIHSSYNEAYQEVFQNIKSLLNNILPNEKWYEIVETKPGSAEVKQAIAFHKEFSNPTLLQKIMLIYDV